MKSVLGLTFVCLFGAFFLLNGLLMAISPRAWFRLPRWIGVHGRLHYEKPSDVPAANLQVRIVGIGWAAIVIWVIYDVLSHH